MPAFLVSLPDQPGHGFHEGNRQVIHAADAAGALLVAQGAFDGDANAMWGAAVAAEIAAGTDLTGYEFTINIFGGDTTGPISVTAKAGPGALAIASGVLGSAAGLLYVDDEISAVLGGVFTRAATFRSDGVGAVTAVDMEDPGEYTELPTLDEMATVAELAGDDALTIDGTAAVLNGYEVFLGQLVGLLNADGQIATADIEMSELLAGPRLFTITAAGDAIGNATVELVFSKPGGVHVAQLSSTITDEGAGGDVLTFAIPAIPLVLPSAPIVLRG